MSDETVGPTCPGLCKKADPLGQPKAMEGRAVAAPWDCAIRTQHGAVLLGSGWTFSARSQPGR